MVFTVFTWVSSFEGHISLALFEVFDPRLMYTMTALRFSQDGDAALFSLQDMAFNADHCSMAYGQYKCKAWTQRDSGGKWMRKWSERLSEKVEKR